MASLSDGQEEAAAPAPVEPTTADASDVHSSMSPAARLASLRNPLAERAQEVAHAGGSVATEPEAEAGPSRAPFIPEEGEVLRGRQPASRRIGADAMEGDHRGIAVATAGLSDGARQPAEHDQAVEERGAQVERDHEQEPGELEQQYMGEQGEYELMDERPPGGGKRVKVYELRDGNWEDQGTGFCEGMYDETVDQALLMVIREEGEPIPPGARGSAARAAQARLEAQGARGPADAAAETGGAAEGDPEGGELAPGGFLRDDEEVFGPGYLLKSKVQKNIRYQRQQDTLIVWPEPITGTDYAVSFQDPQGCNDIWDFIQEIQRHLELVYNEQAIMAGGGTMQSDMDQGGPGGGAGGGSSPPRVSSSPLMSADVGTAMHALRDPGGLHALTLSNLKTQEHVLKMHSRSQVTREKTVEFLVHSDYVKQMIRVFEEAEDLESLEDLHTLCTMMQIMLALNDNTMLEHLVQDELFLGVVGILEYDPEFPTLKASYRDFISTSSRFREPVHFEDEAFRAKIHQTYRLLYLKDVVLARVLDDPNFNIINSLLFFNQVDIINYIQSNESLLNSVFSTFKRRPDSETESEASAKAADEHKAEVVALLHQLVLMGKNVQLPNRLSLYRNLVERGLLYICGWSFRQTDLKVLNPAAEILSFILDHDVHAVRAHALKERALGMRTIARECVDLITSNREIGISGQIADALRAMLDSSSEGNDGPGGPAHGPGKAKSNADDFAIYFYDQCVVDLYVPILNLKDHKTFKAHPELPAAKELAQLQILAELLSFLVSHHGSRAQFFLLANPVCTKMASLLYMKPKGLRHASLRFFRACLKGGNHFLHRHLIKQDLLVPILDLLESEGSSDNMLSSAALEVIEIIRKDNLKSIINHLFENYQGRIQALCRFANLRQFMTTLTTRWEQNNEPPPEETVQAEKLHAWPRSTDDEDDYFNASDDEEIGPQPPKELTAGHKRKRTRSGDVPTMGKAAGKKMALEVNGQRVGGGLAGLGLDYDDASDSDESGGASPQTASAVPLPGQPEQESPSKLSPSAMSAEEGQGSGPKLRFKLGRKASPSPTLGEVASKIDEAAAKMSQKRHRQEEAEEEGGMAGLMSGGRPGTPRTGRAEDRPPESRPAPKSSNALSNAMRETSKKIKLNLGFGRKLGGDLDKKDKKVV